MTTMVRTGERVSLLVPVIDALGLPVAITSGWSARVQVRPSPTSTDVVHEFTTELVTGAAGAVRVTASASETATWQDGPDAWPAGRLAWDVRLVDTLGEPHVLDLGRIALISHVTR